MAIVLIVAVSAGGCTPIFPLVHRKWPPPVALGEADRVALGKIALLWEPPPAQIKYAQIVDSRKDLFEASPKFFIPGAIVGAVLCLGAVGTVQDYALCDLGGAFLIGIYPFILDNIFLESPEEVAPKEKALATALSTMSEPMRAEQGLIDRARRSAGVKLTAVPWAGSASLDEKALDQHLKDQGFDTVLEVHTLGMALAKPGNSNESWLWIDFLLRLRRLSDGRVLLQKSARYVSGNPGLPFPEWVANGDERLREEITKAYFWLVRWAVDEAFTSYHITPTGWVRAGAIHWINVAALPPLTPGLDHTVKQPLRPVFRWKPFPQPAQLSHDALGALLRAQDIRYDFALFRQETVPGPPKKGPQHSIWHEALETLVGPHLIWHKELETLGLKQPEFTPAHPLAPCTDYRWSVRVRFRLDGQERTTAWSTQEVYNPAAPFSFPVIDPSRAFDNYYTFHTACH